MKLFLRVLYSVILSFFLSESSLPQWVKLPGIGGTVFSFTISPVGMSDTNIIAGTQYGVCFSSDNGSSWTQANGMELHKIKSFAWLNTNLFAARSMLGVARSTDNGATWTEASSGITTNLVNAVIVSGTSLFAGTDGRAGIYRSTNNGMSWTAADNGLTNKNVLCLAASTDSSEVNYIYAGTETGVFLSTDNGNNWTNASSGFHLPVNTLLVYDEYILAGTLNSGVFLSTDHGTNWTEVNNGITNTEVRSFAAISDGAGGYKIYAGTTGNERGVVYLSIDNCSSWTSISDQSIGGSVNALLAYDSVSLFAGTPTGIYRTNNDGSDWLKLTGINPRYISTVFGSGNKLFIAGGESLMESIDYGTTSSESLEFGVHCLFSSSPHLYAGTSGAGVYISSNNGSSWIPSNTGISYLYINSFAETGTNLYSGSPFDVYRSSDGGLIWTPLNTNFPGYTFINSLACNESHLFAGTGGGLFLSTNNGASWVMKSSGSVYLIIYRDNKLYCSTTTALSVSTDNGASWYSMSNGLTNRVLSLAFYQEYIFAGMQQEGIFYTTDNGINWQEVNEGFNLPASVAAFTISGEYFVAGTSAQGAWRRLISEIITTIEDQKVTKPADLILGQNYPNPFNPSTTIEYSIPAYSLVIIKLFDILGNEIETLVNEEKPSGNYEVLWDAKGLPSGVYFCRMQTEGYALTRKMILMR